MPRRAGLGIALFLLPLVLAGCGLLPEQDRAPDDLGLTRAIPDAEPEALPLSAYGNPDSYEVLGRRYVVMRSASGYAETGIASWYGTKFHGRRTSSGERYDMYGMTAAHKTLPLPTFVEVTNLGNGRRAVVKVNDRGPFHENRLIDLSYAAARKLGVYPAGTAVVRVRAIDPGEWRRQKEREPVPDRGTLTASLPPPSVSEYDLPGQRGAGRVSLPSAVTPAADGTPTVFYLQVGAFSARDNAARLMDRIAGALGVGRVRMETGPSAGGLVYRVQVGPLVDVDLADSLVTRLESLGIMEHQVVID